MSVEAIRVVAMYATKWTHLGEWAIGPERYFELGKLEEYYALFADQLKQFMHEVQPSGLNQEGRVHGWITPYVSLLFGHQRYVEDSVFLTTVQAIGTAARFRQIWRDAYEDVRTFRTEKLAPDVGQQSRDSLEELVDRLGNLELDLSFSVETSADMGLLIPSLRIESFHRAIYEVLELPKRAQTVSRMFARLDSSSIGFRGNGE